MPVGDKYGVKPREWVCLVVHVVMFVPLTYQVWNLWAKASKILEDDRKAVAHSPRNRGTGTIDSVNPMTRFKKLNDRMSGGSKYLLLFTPMHLIMATGVTMYIAYILDLVTWVYHCGTGGLWDWFIVVTDGVIEMVAGIAWMLLLLVFTQRCYLTFDGTPLQHSQWKYGLLFALIVLGWVIDTFIGVCTMSLLWKMLSYANVAGFVQMVAAFSLTLWYFYQPLMQLAANQASGKLLHLATRIAVNSAISLASTCILIAFGFVGFAICEDCTLVVIYYILTPIDAFINVQCLIWTLKTGQSSYYKWCKCLHRALVEFIDSRPPELRTPMPWLQPADDKSMMSRTVGSTSKSDRQSVQMPSQAPEELSAGAVSALAVDSPQTPLPQN